MPLRGERIRAPALDLALQVALGVTAVAIAAGYAFDNELVLDFKPLDAGGVEATKAAFLNSCNRGESNKADHFFLYLWENMPHIEAFDLLMSVAIPKNVLDTLEVHLVSKMDDVLKIALAGPLPTRLETPAVVAEVADAGDTRTH